MAHMNRTGLPWLFHRHTLGIDGDRGAGGSGRFFRRSGASAADLFDQRFDRYIGGRKGTLTLQAGLQTVSQIQPLLPGSRGQSAERADDALTGTTKCKLSDPAPSSGCKCPSSVGSRELNSGPALQSTLIYLRIVSQIISQMIA